MSPTAQLTPVVQEYVDAVTKSQTVFLNTVEAWTEQVYAGFQELLATREAPSTLPTPAEAVDAVFAQITAQMNKGLELQQQFVRGIADAAAPLVTRAVADTQNAVETFTTAASTAATTATGSTTKATASRSRKS